MKHSPQTRRVFELDLLRFLAAASVMLYHYTYHYSQDGGARLSAIALVTRHGYLGVDVFFVISGFVVLWSALGRSPAQFVRARVLRLYPEFWICVMLSAAAFWLLPGDFGNGLRPLDVMLNLTMLPGYLGVRFVDGVYWTLAVEIKFYFLIWALLLLKQLGHIERWLYAWLGLSLVATVVDVGPVLRSITIFPYGVLFASGGLFYLVFDSGWSLTRVLGLLVGVTLGAYHAIRQMPNFIDVVHISPVAQAVTATIIVLTFVLFSLVGRHQASATVLTRAAVLGGLTYPLYLLHNIGKEAFLNVSTGLPGWAAVTMAIGLSLALSYGVMRVGTGVAREALREGWDRLLGSTSARPRRVPAD